MSKVQNGTKKTLDTQYISKIQEFGEKETIVGKIQKDIEKLALDIMSLKEKQSEMNDYEFESYMQKQDQLADLKCKLDKLQKYDEELDYYVNTAPILFQYYEILKNGNENTQARKPVANEKSILKYFIGASQPKEDEKPKEAPIDRAGLLEKYMHITDPHHIKTVEKEQKDCCPHCDSTDRNVLVNDGLVYCNSCNTVEYIIIDHERPTYKDPPREISYFAYKRICALKSHMPRLSGIWSWKNILAPCFVAIFSKNLRFFENLAQRCRWLVVGA